LVSRRTSARLRNVEELEAKWQQRTERGARRHPGGAAAAAAERP
jgi:hypothetical protein